MKKLILIFILLSLLLLSSCVYTNSQMQDDLMGPETKQISLSGKWIAEKIIEGPNKYISSRLDPESQLIYEALFHPEGVVVGNNYSLSPKYSYKNVNLSDYLLYKYKITSDSLELEEMNVDIYTINEDDMYFNEFIKYSDDQIIVFDNDRFYFLKQASKEVSKEEVDRYIQIEKNIKRISNKEETDSLRSGVLLGIKSLEKDENGIDQWLYKTIWIKYTNRTLSNPLYMDKLLVARKRGFWIVDVTRDRSNGIKDIINANEQKILEEDLGYLYGFTSLKRKAVSNPSKESGLLREIDYISNDYIALEETNLENNIKELKVYPIDFLSEEIPIRISEVIGHEGLESFYQDAKDVIKDDIGSSINEENFGLARRNGYWIMKGRVNVDKDQDSYYKDFNIKIIPPKELVNYDELLVTWNKIKSQVPEALDAFTSPNEDIILVLTRNNILIYPIEGGQINLKELGRIKINPSETIVMAEWALGRYVSFWEDEVLRNGGQVIKY